MQIVRHRPAARGVTELMYVGDDQAVENAVAGRPTTDEFLAGLASALIALKSKGLLQVAGASIASVIAYRWYNSRG